MMNYSQMKEELKLIRENRARINLIVRQLNTIRDDGLSAAYSGAIDYAKDRVQSSGDPDGKLVNTIEKINKQVEWMEKRVIELREENKKLESLLERAPGLAGEITRAYYINCHGIRYISKAVNYSSRQCWRYVDNTIDWLVQEVNKNEENL